jgi:hypothetical protein
MKKANLVSKVGMVGIALLFGFGCGGLPGTSNALQAHKAALDSSDSSTGATVSFSSDGSEDASSGAMYLSEGSHSLGVVYTNADGTAGDATSLSFSSDDASVEVDSALGEDGSLSVQVNPAASANLVWLAADGSTGSIQIVGLVQDDASLPELGPDQQIP